MKKFILFAALVAGAASGVAAKEQTRLGVRAGLNFDSQKFSVGGISTTSDNKLGFHVGAVVDVPLASCASSLPQWLYFQPGLYLTTKGSKGQVATHNLYCLELPLLASVKVSLTDNFKIRADVGPSVGFALSGKSKTGSVSADIFNNDRARRFYAGLDFGAGVEYKRFYLGVGYDLGLSSLYDDSSVKNRTLSVSLGYSF
jgi:hypothetical protein